MVSTDHKVAALGVGGPGGDQNVAARHDGTVVKPSTAPNRASAAPRKYRARGTGRQQSKAVGDEGSGGNGGRETPREDGEGDQECGQKSNRREAAREEGSARRWAPAAAAGVAGASRGSPSSAQGGQVASSRECVRVKRNRACVVGPTDRLTGSVGFNPTRSPDQRAPGPIYKN